MFGTTLQLLSFAIIFAIKIGSILDGTPFANVHNCNFDYIQVLKSTLYMYMQFMFCNLDMLLYKFEENSKLETSN